MHKKNVHKYGYDFTVLTKAHRQLKPFVTKNDYGSKSIDFSNPEAVFHLNKALLISGYGLTNWKLPEGHLCPPIPGRADYMHHLAELLLDETSEEKNIKGLDVGTGASCIYPILGAKIYGWSMVGCDSSDIAMEFAKKNIALTGGLSNFVDLRHQTDNGNILKGIIQPNEHFSFTMCNPPFFKSAEDAEKEALRKFKNLHNSEDLKLNFGGQANELWCNGGEALFIKRLIKESVGFKDQVGWFTTLVSKSEHLPKLEKQLKKLQTEVRILPMFQGHKKSRILAWRFR